MPAFTDRQIREMRLHDPGTDARGPFERDRDRILYSDEFRRLAGITQVISPHDHTFHNRLTHTLEVAQIGRRMAQYILGTKEYAQRSPEQFIDADVVEAACLAHDLGHPPFGHVAEKELDRLGRDAGGNGFEGNAHSFRIITHLTLHGDDRYRGLDLTRATLNAVLKYPWFRDTVEGGKRFKKFGAYESDHVAFNFARKDFPDSSEPRSLEAQIMDHADAIAYAVHDLMDFHRAGLIPLYHLMTTGFENFFQKHRDDIMEGVDGETWTDAKAMEHLLETIRPLEPYEGTREQQMTLKVRASGMINRYIVDPQVDWSPHNPVLIIPIEHTLEINFLKSIIWHYIIDRPQLGTQQHGMRKVIAGLFEIYLDTINSEDRKVDSRIIPQLLKPDYDVLRANRADGQQDNAAEIRLAIDIIAGLSDGQALELYRRLLGVEPGKITDLIAQ